MAVTYWVKFRCLSLVGYMASPISAFFSPSIQFSFPRLALFCPTVGLINGNHSIQRRIPHHILSSFP